MALAPRITLLEAACNTRIKWSRAEWQGQRESASERASERESKREILLRTYFHTKRFVFQGAY